MVNRERIVIYNYFTGKLSEFPEKVVVHNFIVFWDENTWTFSWKLRRAGGYFTKLSQGTLSNLLGES